MKKIREFIEKLRELFKEENREALALLFREIVYLLKHGRFRYVKGELEIGLTDPYLMGQVLSALSFTYPLYGQELSIKPYFDREELSGELRIKGHLRLIHVLLSLIRLLKNRTIRELVLKRKES